MCDSQQIHDAVLVQLVRAEAACKYVLKANELEKFHRGIEQAAKVTSSCEYCCIQLPFRGRNSVPICAYKALRL